ncbi:hypothetical protein SELR_23550 [Selenomonas ruminantium subsp. lactilytica TAM6421]|uniref:Uncharacterized protein n=1 Tax=Selenomonas ruminantium subsp. lactilytica (strain NBRC 103574 / TAM6421) TaxID=927704 RepID=I0GTH6_SELRL|nr:hypothetical protein [Selenomonas ruminantium]BAL84063.1 hypothetical protein SELR_23550 [Selenomonas ruminantium subsp. lactilytica TAM6421]
MDNFREINCATSNELPLLGRSVTDLLLATPGAQLLQSILAGASVPFSIGYTVGGALVFAYAQWLVQQALQMGLDRLYFLARDGFVVQKAVEYIIQANSLSLRTSYLYSSRRAWRLPSFDGSSKCFGELLAQSFPHSLQDFANICQLSIDEMRKYVDIPEQQRLNDVNARQLILKLQHNTELRRKIFSQQTGSRFSLLAYLKQELDLEKGNFGLVDVQGTGYTSSCIANLLSYAYNRKIPTFFYVLVNPVVSSHCHFLSFIDTKLSSSSLMELFTRALHGQTIGYEKSPTGEMQPVLKGHESVELNRYGYRDYLEGVKQSCLIYSHRIGLHDGAFSSAWASNILKAVDNEPDTKLFNFFASMPISSDGHHLKVYAPSLDRRDWRMINLNLREYFGGNIRWSERLYERIHNKYPYTYRHSGLKILKKYERLYGHSLMGREVPSYFVGVELTKRVTLYGAGKIGEIVFYELTRKHKIHISQWIDCKFTIPGFYDGIRTCNLNSANWFAGECIIIAISNLDIAQGVEKEIRVLTNKMFNNIIINLAHFIDTKYFLNYLDSLD